MGYLVTEATRCQGNGQSCWHGLHSLTSWPVPTKLNFNNFPYLILHNSSWEMIVRSNFMRLKIAFFMISKLQSWDQNYNHEIKVTTTRSKFFFFMRLKVSIILIQRSTPRSWDHEIKKALLATFDLMIEFVANNSIMRSKLKKHY